MPCSDPWPTYRDCGHQPKLDKLTRMLCDWCKHPEEQPNEVWEWYQEHQVADKRRRQQEHLTKLKELRQLEEQAQALEVKLARARRKLSDGQS